MTAHRPAPGWRQTGLAELADRAGLLLAAPTRAEAKAVATGGLTVVQTGIGADRAVAVLEKSIGPDTLGIVSIGTAAGLLPGQHSGDLLLPATVLGRNGESFPTHAGWRQALVPRLTRHGPVHDGPLVQADAVLTDREAKTALATRSGAAAADMESAGIAALAVRRQLACLVVRVLLDPLELSIPPCAAASVDLHGELQPGRLLAGLLRQPTDVFALLRLAAAWRRARSRLAGTARILAAATADPSDIMPAPVAPAGRSKQAKQWASR